MIAAWFELKQPVELMLNIFADAYPTHPSSSTMSVPPISILSPNQDKLRRWEQQIPNFEQKALEGPCR